MSPAYKQWMRWDAISVFFVILSCILLSFGDEESATVFLVFAVWAQGNRFSRPDS